MLVIHSPVGFGGCQRLDLAQCCNKQDVASFSKRTQHWPSEQSSRASSGQRMPRPLASFGVLRQSLPPISLETGGLRYSCFRQIEQGLPCNRARLGPWSARTRVSLGPSTRSEIYARQRVQTPEPSASNTFKDIARLPLVSESLSPPGNLLPSLCWNPLGTSSSSKNQHCMPILQAASPHLSPSNRLTSSPSSTSVLSSNWRARSVSSASTLPPAALPVKPLAEGSLMAKETETMARPVRATPISRHAGSSVQYSPSDTVRGTFEPFKFTADGYPVNNKIKKAKYATSIDDRGYLSVYEFSLNDQTIMWDHTTGFVHLTGIWKALGNSKADIVKLIDNHPELEGVIRRIRGGFLKIQGTWVPYELGKSLAKRTCWPLRHAMVSVFGPNFPQECLQPGDLGYGTLTLNDDETDSKKKRKRKAQQSVSVVSVKRPAREKAVQSSAPKTLAQAEKRRRLEGTFASAAVAMPRPARKVAKPKRYVEEEEDDVSSLHSASTGMSEVVEVPVTNGYTPSKLELLDLLRASRSLQQLSTGCGSFDKETAGGIFDVQGMRFRWDGGMEGRSGLTRVGVSDARDELPEPELEDDDQASSAESASITGSQLCSEYDPRMASTQGSPAQMRSVPVFARQPSLGKSFDPLRVRASFQAGAHLFSKDGHATMPQPGPASAHSSNLEHDLRANSPPQQTQDGTPFGLKLSLGPVE